MVKYIADPIILPDDYSPQDLEDAKICARWHRVRTRDDVVNRTDLSGKCGSCRWFLPKEGKRSCRGNCGKGRTMNRQRTTKACTLYEKKRGPKV